MSRAGELAERRARLMAVKLRRSLWAFALYFWPIVTGFELPDNTASRALCAALQAVADGRIWRLLVAFIPGGGKSTWLVMFSAWRLARRGDWRSLHAMAASADANRESLRVRRLVSHAEFVALFPHVAFAADENTIAAWATTKGGRYTALGLDGAVTSKRALELVMDDPMSAADRHSKTERDRVWTWLEESAKSRLDGDRAPIIIVAQRLDRDDIHARCLSSGEQWCILEPAAKRDGRGLELRDHTGELVWADDRKPDELIAPQLCSEEKLAGLSKSVRTTQFQQRPEEDDGGASISRAAWRFHAPKGANPNAARPRGCVSPADAPTVETPVDFERICISIDPTFGGTKNTNDFACIQVWGSSGPGRYLLDRWKKRAKQLEQRAQVKAFRAKYPRATIVIEKSAGGLGAIEELEAEGVENVEGVTVGSSTGGKAARLDNVSPTIEQGFAFLPIGMHDLQDFVDELAGATSHDDDQDACSQALHWLNTHAIDDPLELMRRANVGLGALLGLDGAREPDPVTEAERRASASAEKQRRDSRLDRIEAKHARGERLSRGEQLHLRLWRKKQVGTGPEQKRIGSERPNKSARNA